MSSRRGGNDPRARTFDVVTAVWGPEFRQLFVDVCVPNQATPGNLGALPPGSRYRVFTSAEDVEFLETSPALRRASDVIPVDVVAVPEVSRASEDRFVRMTVCHVQALKDAAASGAALIFLSPDLVMSEGALAAVVRRQRSGARVVACSGVRVHREPFIAALQAQGDACIMSPRDLVRLGLNHLHPFTRAHMVDSEQAVLRPTGVYWNVSGEGILARYFYLHPLMVDPARRDVLPHRTIDQHYVFESCPVREQIQVIADSDELAIFEMSHIEGAPRDTGPGGISPWRAATMLCRCDLHQQSYWRTPIRLHVGDVGARWHRAEKESACFARRAMRLRLAALWMYRTSRRVRPLLRKARQVRKHFRDAAKELAPGRLRRSLLRATQPAQEFQEEVLRAGRVVRRRVRRSMGLLAHSTARPLHKLRKRAARAGRRLLRRVHLAH